MVVRRRLRQRGQGVVEFALVAPVLLLLLLIALDFGRGLLYYTEMATGAREASRQAVLKYNNRSNLSAPSCSPCVVPGVVPQLRTIAGMGYPAPVFAPSSSATAAPWYGTYSPPPPGKQLGTITLNASARPNTLYVFVYELDPSTGKVNWATCDPCDGVRSGGGRLVVVDLKMKFQPVALGFLPPSASMTFDAQTVSREEW